MHVIQRFGWAIAALVGLASFACSGGGGGGGGATTSCVAGATSSCLCTDGASGAQTCNPGGTFDACACAGGSEDGGHRGKDTTEAGAESNSSDGPKFLSLGTNVNKLTENQSVTITAVLTDPDGIGDLIGGSLTNDDESVQYGAFVTSGEEGSYSLTLSWETIAQAKPIIFSTPDQPRAFTAQFFDAAGHKTTRTVTISLTCNGLLGCGLHCAQTCSASSKTRQSCDQTCSQTGMTCNSSSSCERIAYYGYGAGGEPHLKMVTCSQTPTATYDGSQFSSVQCCCSPP